jgi:RNA polymerase sigma factor (sigma-70 family)
MSGGPPGVADRLGAPFESILLAAQEGAGWAAERLWVSLAPAVAGYLRVQGAAEPDDLTSEVFIGVFRGIGAFSGSEAQFRSWVFTIAHRRLTDDRRRAGRRFQSSRWPEPGQWTEPEPVLSAEQQALRRLGSEGVRRLCRLLPPDQRDVLLLRLVGDLTVEEVAEAVGKSPGAVKALQRRAILALRRRFEREGVPL